MKAMIFAAGLGTRLRPLTNNKPKALVEVGGKSLLEHNILRLKSFGYNEIVINVHYLGQMIVDFIDQHEAFGLQIYISDESNKLLDTGGGLKHAQHLLNGTESFLLCNVDVLSDIDLNQLRKKHEEEDALATLAIRNRVSSRYLLFDEKLELCGWKNEKTADQIISKNIDSQINKFAFSGIQMVNPRIFNQIEESGVFSTIPMYLRLSREEKIIGFTHNEGHWIDVGKFEHFDKAEDILHKIDNV